MESFIEYRDFALEDGTFDQVVAVIEDRIAALKAKGFEDVHAAFHAAEKTAHGEVRGWTVTLEARKPVHD